MSSPAASVAGGWPLNFTGHFALLSSIAAVLAATSFGPLAHWQIADGAVPQFALYGALHAACVVLTLRARIGVGRRLVFVAASALSSLLTVRIGLYALTLAATAVPAVRPVAIVVTCAWMGALAYGVLIRAVLNFRFMRGALAVTSSLCALATAAAVFACRRFEAPAGLWLAIPWWFAFSGGIYWAARHRPVQ